MSDARQAALLAAIDGEEAAVYAYGVAIPRLAGPSADLARGGLAAHRLQVIALREQIPIPDQPPAPAGYSVDTPVDAAGASELLGRVESSLAAVYADVAATSEGESRRQAVLAAREAATRSVAWGSPPQAFPGR